MIVTVGFSGGRRLLLCRDVRAVMPGRRGYPSAERVVRPYGARALRRRRPGLPGLLGRRAAHRRQVLLGATELPDDGATQRDEPCQSVPQPAHAVPQRRVHLRQR